MSKNTLRVATLALILSTTPALAAPSRGLVQDSFFDRIGSIVTELASWIGLDIDKESCDGRAEHTGDGC